MKPTLRLVASEPTPKEAEVHRLFDFNDRASQELLTAQARKAARELGREFFRSLRTRAPR